jgi:hypothetical protein
MHYLIKIYVETSRQVQVSVRSCSFLSAKPAALLMLFVLRLIKALHLHCDYFVYVERVQGTGRILGFPFRVNERHPKQQNRQLESWLQVVLYLTASYCVCVNMRIVSGTGKIGQFLQYIIYSYHKIQHLLHTFLPVYFGSLRGSTQ